MAFSKIWKPNFLRKSAGILTKRVAPNLALKLQWQTVQKLFELTTAEAFGIALLLSNSRFHVQYVLILTEVKFHILGTSLSVINKV